MEIQKFKEISTSVYANIQALTPTDMDVLRDILRLAAIKYGRIRTFSPEDSQEIILLTLKQNCLILIKFLLENQIELPESLLDNAIDLLFAKKERTGAPQATGRTEVDLTAQIEKERIEEQIFNIIVDIVYAASYGGERLKEFLANKGVPDDASVNFAPAIDCEYKSFELIVLNKLMVGPVLLSLIRSYKNRLRRAAKIKIIDGLVKVIDTADTGIIYEIFYLINDREHNELLKKRRPEYTPEYLGFVASLILGKESAEIAYEKLAPLFDDLEYALSVLASSSRVEEKLVQPKDEVMIEYALACMSRLVEYKSINFYKFLQNFQAVLKMRISGRIKGSIYEILCYYVSDKDVYVEQVVECRAEIEKELRSREFFLLPRLVRFINAYQRREAFETELLAQGKSIGSPYVRGAVDSGARLSAENAGNTGGAVRKAGLHTEELLDYKVFGLRSEDPDTVIECFDSPIAPETLSLNSVHIRNAIIKDKRVIEKIVAYQVANKAAIEDISIINMILCTSCREFFAYARLFDDFSFYMNGDVLERISDNLSEGIDWLIEAYNREIGLFVLRNCTYFNDMLRANRWAQARLLVVYERILNENLGAVDILVAAGGSESADTFLVFDDDESVLNDEFFRVFTKQLLYAKFIQGTDCSRFVLKGKYLHPGAALYLKAKLVAGFDILPDIRFMKANLADTDDIAGYLRIINGSTIEPGQGSAQLSQNILMNFGVKDSLYFLKNFGSSSDLEKFVLFFSLDHANKDVEAIIKDEVMRSLKSPNKVYLTMCILQLFKCRDIDNILKILEKNFSDKELLFKLNIHNIIQGGRYCSKALITQVSPALAARAVFLLYYMDVWEKEYLIEIINRMDGDLSEDIKYLATDIKKY